MTSSDASASSETELDTEARAEPEPAPAPADAPDAVRAEPGSLGPRWLPALAASVALASLLGPIAVAGIWDPYELKVADLARRIALNLLGAHNLAVEGAVNTVPTLGELARGQLPFSSAALGFKLFGLHEWAGRLPLALWGLAGALCTYALLARLADRVAAAFSVIALVTMPLYFLHARTILGDVVTMSALAIAVTGWSLAAFDRGSSRPRRVAWLLVGAVGLAAGFAARGALVGVATPALGVGLAWLLLRTRAGGRREPLGDAVGGLALAAGVAAAWLGVRAMLQAAGHPTQFNMLLGAAANPARQLPTFDAVIHYLGHGLYPWSAVVPFAIGRLMRPPHGVEGDAAERETALRVVVILCATLAFGAHTVLAPTVGLLPFSGVFALAAIAGLALRDFDRGAPGSRAMALGVAALAILLYYDFKNFPEKGLSAFVVDEPRFPESFKEPAHRFLKLGTAGFLAVFVAAFLERTDPAAPRFASDEYLSWPRQLKRVWGGNLWFTFLVAEAALLGYAGLAWLSREYTHWKQFQNLSPLARQLATYGWIVLPAVVIVAPLLALLARDLVRTAFLKIPVSRALAAVVGVALCGATLSFGYYPALASQISPRDVFVGYKRLAKPGERLASIGVGSGAAKYYAKRDVPSFDSPQNAFSWLTEADERRWLVVRANDLAQINSLFRGLPGSQRNVPVLDARSSEILLLSNRLEAGEVNANPLGKWVLDQAPRPTHPLEANLGEQLDVVGWDVTQPNGQPVDSVVPQTLYDFRIYYRVVAPISGTWETFIHIDGFQRRFNGDHQTVENKYAFNLWRVGDHIVDVYPFKLEPNFTPGDYDVFFGLFSSSRRLEVKRGRHNDNRLEAGKLRVR